MMTVATGAAAGGGIAELEALLIGRSEAIVRVRNLIMRLAGSQASVLVTGPSGTGKEVVARCLHLASARRNNEFVAVNCGAIPRELIESELFGHEKGAFTGALQSRKGRFEAADGGTIFLDEIGDMPADMQVKLLRVLEERKIERVGSNKTMAVDVRVISATHKNLEQAIAEGRFREDLFYRLNIFPLQLPALADRREDIPMLVAHFLKQSGTKLRFDASALRALCQHNWPGNIREMENRLKKAIVLTDGNFIGPDDLGLSADELPAILPLTQAKERFQRDYINEVLALNNGNRTKTARDLGVDPRTIFRHLEKEETGPKDADADRS